MIWTTIGWLGSFFLAICALPQVYKTYKTRDVSSISFSMLWTWVLGCTFALAFGLHKGVHPAIITSYVINGGAAFALLVAYFMYRKKK